MANDRVDQVNGIQVSVEELLMLLGRLYLENYTLQKRLAMPPLRDEKPPEETPPADGPKP